MHTYNNDDVSLQDLRRIRDWDDKAREERLEELSGATRDAASDLIKHLLEPDPVARAEYFSSSMDKVFRFPL